jgi:hypothetical protein
VKPVLGDAPVGDIKVKSRAKHTEKASSTGTKGKGQEEQQQKQCSASAGEVNAERYAIQTRGHRRGRACSGVLGRDNGGYGRECGIRPGGGVEYS